MPDGYIQHQDEDDEDDGKKPKNVPKTENSLSLQAWQPFILVSCNIVYCSKLSFKQENKPKKATTLRAND